MKLTEKINNIIDQRRGTGVYEGKGRLGLIDIKLATIIDLEARINNLNSVLKEIKHQKGSKKGSYFELIEKDPIFSVAIENLSLIELKEKVAKQKERLEVLKKRFARECIQIALFGYARQGKSLFLQKITGLEDDVIPTSSDTDCTGAISIIENVKDGGFSMDVEFYSEQEFITAVNNSLELLYGNSRYNVWSLKDIENANFPEDSLLCRPENKEDDNKPELLRILKHDVIKGYPQYKDLIGRGSIHFDSKQDVIEYVAKFITYKKGEIIPDKYKKAPYWIERRTTEDKVIFCKFVAVKKANIKTHFIHPDAGKIVLVDTIGLGNVLTHEQDKAKLLEVLKEECDAAIFLNLVSTLGAPQLDKRVTDLLKEVYKDIEEHNPDKWIIGVLNRDARGDETYHERVKDRVKDYTAAKGLGVAWWTDANACDTDEVNERVVDPLLKTITTNLDEIDTSFMKSVDEMGDDLYCEYKYICDTIQGTIQNLAKNNANTFNMIRSEFKNIQLRPTMRCYVEDLEKLIDSNCVSVTTDIEAYIDGITTFVPKQKQIRAIFDEMSSGGVGIAGAYEKCLDMARAGILSSVKSVSSRSIRLLQERVKSRLISILYYEGLLSKLTLSESVANEPTIGWLNAFYREKLPMYSVLYSAFESLSEFETNIEGFIYSKFICACDILRPNKTTAPTPSGDLDVDSQNIWSQTLNIVDDIKTNLKREFGIQIGVHAQQIEGNEIKQPNVLMWCMAHTFYEEILSGKGLDELECFYVDNGTILWREKIIKSQGMGDAVMAWNSVVGEFISQCNINNFKLIRE